MQARPYTKPSAFSDQPVAPNRRRRVEEWDEELGVWRIYRGELDQRSEPAALRRGRGWRWMMWAALVVVAGVVFLVGAMR